jgi:hypothetical protein
LEFLPLRGWREGRKSLDAARSEGPHIHLTRHSGARAPPASPESMTALGGYGFRIAALSRGFRNDELRDLVSRTRPPPEAEKRIKQNDDGFTRPRAAV